jgi:hypothetical protein
MCPMGAHCNPLLPHQEARRDCEPSMQKGLISADFSYLPGPGTPVNLAPGHPNLSHVGNVWGPMANDWFPSTFK